MEFPFKYIVLCIIKDLNERNMPLAISRNRIITYLTTLINKAFHSILEKIEFTKNINLDYELSNLINNHSYFDIHDNKIIFDSDYIYELDALIEKAKDEYDIDLISKLDLTMDMNKITFLEIIGVKIRKELYELLKNIEIEIKDCYNKLYKANSNVEIKEIDTSKLINKLKKLYMKKRILLINAKNLLSIIEYSDLIKYANSRLDEATTLEDINLLYSDEDFNAENIMYDTILRSIFTSNASYTAIIWESLCWNFDDISEDIKCSIIKFYQVFLELLDKEIESSSEILSIEMERIKYEIINAMDSIYGTALFIHGKNSIIGNHQIDEKYKFIESTIYYFINELLMYDDDMYKNKECSTDNIMLDLDNTMKKLLIETFYYLTGDENIICAIKSNKLYEINSISSNYLKDIINKPKTKIKGK